MIATTIEQSKHLLELGLDPKTADMYYLPQVMNEGETLRPIDEGYDLDDADQPAWSLSALLEVIPKTLLPTLEWRDGENEWEVYAWVDHNIHSISHYDKLIAAYEMVCWLLENNLIKKGGQDGRDRN